MASFIKKQHVKRGRPPQCEPTVEDVEVMKNLLQRTNVNRGGGSKILAARLAARQGLLSAPVAEAILKPRAGNAIPACISNAIYLSPQVFARQRNTRDADLSGIYCPGSMRMVKAADGAIRRLQPGERQSWDDATINFGVCIPWPWGGDKCADKFGVKVGRFQLLTCVDDASDFCPGFSYVIREQQSYRAEDTAAAQYRLATRTYQPRSYMLEGGVWQCKRAHVFYQEAGIRVEDATGRPHSKLVECFFNRLWTTLSPLPGNVGRFRGEQKKESDIYVACRQGRKDPRKYFPLLNDALADIAFAMEYLNTTPVHSDKYGSWQPREMHDGFLAEHPLPRMAESLAFHAAPVFEERTVQRGMIRMTCRSPYGESFLYHFAEENLYRYDGAAVRVYFDPWAEHDLQAAVVLAKPFHGEAAGTKICDAVCLDEAPRVRMAAEGMQVSLMPSPALAMRNKARSAVRREHRVIGQNGKTQIFASEIRAPGLLQTVQSMGPAEPQDALSEAEAAMAETGIRLERRSSFAKATEDKKQKSESDTDLPWREKELPRMKTLLELAAQ